MAKLNYNLDDIPDAPVIPKGRYKLRLMSVVKQQSSKGNPMLVWMWKIVSPGKMKGVRIKSWTSLLENALSGLKMHLLALGKKGKVKGNTDKLVGLRVVGVIGKRIGRNQMGQKTEFSSILGLLPAGTSLAADDEEDEEDIDDEDEDDEVDDEDDDEGDDDEDDDESEDDDDDDEEEEPPRKKKKTASTDAASLKKKAAAKRRPPEDDDDDDEDEDDEDDDDDDDEDEAPF